MAGPKLNCPLTWLRNCCKEHPTWPFSLEIKAVAGRGASPARNRMCDGPPKQGRMLTGHFLLRRITWWGPEHRALGDRELPWNTWLCFVDACIYMCVSVYMFSFFALTPLTWMGVWRKAGWIRMYEQYMWEMPGSRRKKGLQRGSGQLGQTQQVMEFRSPDPEEVETQIIATVEPGG